MRVSEFSERYHYKFKGGIDIMIFDFPECGGCRTCELACSFRLIGGFNNKNSCIKIVENKNKGGFLVNFLENKDNFPFECDYCSNEEEPLCVQYCTEGEKLKELISKFVSYREKQIFKCDNSHLK